MALAGALYRYRFLIHNLVMREIHLKYRGSLVGLMWSLLNPILQLAVYTLAFKQILRVGVEGYPAFLAVGLLPWSFFASAVVAATGAITSNGALVKKLAFPREVLPVATVLFWFAQLLVALLVLVPVLSVVEKIGASWTVLLVVPLLALHLCFTVGVAFALSALATSFRDLTHLTEVGLLLLFWLTPVVYPITMAPPTWQPLLRLSPPGTFSIAYQELLFWGRLPGPGVAGGVLVWPMLSLAVGHRIFRAYRASLAEDL